MFIPLSVIPLSEKCPAQKVERASLPRRSSNVCTQPFTANETSNGRYESTARTFTHRLLHSNASTTIQSYNPKVIIALHILMHPSTSARSSPLRKLRRAPHTTQRWPPFAQTCIYLIHGRFQRGCLKPQYTPQTPSGVTDVRAVPPGRSLSGCHQRGRARRILDPGFFLKVKGTHTDGRRAPHCVRKSRVSFLKA